MERGSSGAAVEALQARLAYLGFDPGPVDGDFGGVTDAAVRAFQRSKGLAVNGSVGPETAFAEELRLFMLGLQNEPRSGTGDGKKASKVPRNISKRLSG